MRRRGSFLELGEGLAFGAGRRCIYFVAACSPLCEQTQSIGHRFGDVLANATASNNRCQEHRSSHIQRVHVLVAAGAHTHEHRFSKTVCHTRMSAGPKRY